MPLAARTIVLIHLALLVPIFTAGTMAGEPPPQPDGLAPPESFSNEKRSHWAYQPVKPVEPPNVKDSRWVRNPIDRFLLATLDELGWSPAAEADRVALIRRVTTT
jgi:hypothetical protein